MWSRKWVWKKIELVIQKYGDFRKIYETPQQSIVSFDKYYRRDLQDQKNDK